MAKSLERLLRGTTKKELEGRAWHCDHTTPVCEGGGRCDVSGCRTLCVSCHLEITATQATVRSKKRANDDGGKSISMKTSKLRKSSKAKGGSNLNASMPNQKRKRGRPRKGGMHVKKLQWVLSADQSKEFDRKYMVSAEERHQLRRSILASRRLRIRPPSGRPIRVGSSSSSSTTTTTNIPLHISEGTLSNRRRTLATALAWGGGDGDEQSGAGAAKGKW
jgi:hypothetical protein